MRISDWSSDVCSSDLQSIADLNASVPSLSFVDGGPSQRRVVIRGIQAAGEPTVGTYYDETPVTGVIGAGNDAGGSTPERSEERRAGQEWVSPGESRWVPAHQKKHQNIQTQEEN